MDWLILTRVTFLEVFLIDRLKQQWQPVERQLILSFLKQFSLLQPPKNQQISSLLVKLKSLDKASFSPRLCITDAQLSLGNAL